MALKLDVSKAYDKVEWPFLEQVMSKLESFSSLLQHAEVESSIRGIVVCQGAPPISHLLFADDTLVFYQACPASTQKIREVLDIYRCASSQEINFSKSSRVSDLIDPQSHDWDLPKLMNLLWPEDCDLIASIPLSHTPSPDLRIRYYSRNGLFSIQSAYHLACSLEDRSGSSSLLQTEHTWWRKVWQAKLPNKIKVFTWRACINALPTGKALSKRVQGLSMLWPFCSFQEEDVLHTLVHFSTRLGDAEFRLILCICWSIWWCRNGLNSDGTVKGVPIVQPHWTAPSSGYIKVNFDGATFQNGQEIGVRVVARGTSGECLAWLSKRVRRLSTGEMAEALAAREAVLLA
ncbi:UNVERIFIED_CONTAM: hypothetical protein Scaly_2505500 [Sesamum calycinum]|uniref:Reverse transcriptase zinc-binding domain-containing protein n=1 Tax=Sesamum calycinum TaxID=2727403 RepID=A0AAW2LW87_9LAMI